MSAPIAPRGDKVVDRERAWKETSSPPPRVPELRQAFTSSGARPIRSGGKNDGRSERFDRQVLPAS